ncbi:MAG: TonB-dependent receptor [Ignavibacterium sp.]|jgi:outer membrane receptor protein involved in Fe transport|uniref:TonB-dependent receptor domain-containing protein n=1 Tax=Ignavibacterium sp. TaxID=2651167 RepID=UPI00329A56AA
MFNRNLLIAFLIFANLGFTQNRQGNFQGMQLNGKITGKIIDAQTKQIIEYCNVVLFSYRDSAMVNGTITDKEGKFTLSNLRPGFYFLRASYIGYDNRTIDSIRITPNKPEIDLGIIALDEKTIELSNVVVTGEKEVIINNLDKKVINVEKDLTNLGGTAVDVVQNIPSVTVDADGNVSYRGNQNVRILIDGKPSELLGLGSGDVLSNIPASQIESIELVTNPSARYDPEGTGGILNIVLKKRINGGLNGNISLTGGTGEKFNGSLNFNYKLPDVNLFASIDSRIHNADNNGNSLRTNNINNSLSYLDQLSNGTFNHFGHNFTAGLDITPDSYNTYTFSLRYRKFGFDTESLVKTSTLNSQSQLTRYFERSSDAERRMNALQYNLSYRRTFDTKGAELTADVILGDFKMKRDENFNQLNFDNSLNPVGNLLQKGLSDNKNIQWTIQSNYINPIEGFGRIEIGFKVTLKNFNSKNDYLTYDNNSAIWLNDISRKTDFDYKENVYAVYGIYSNSISDFQYQIGLRAEQADVKGTENLTNSSFTNDYFSVYPTIHLVQSLAEQQEVQLSYSRRVERPNNRRLNPYVDRSDSLNISYGNPELKPEYINSLELGYSKLFGKTALTSSIFYRNTNDAITNYTIVNADGITETTWRNLAKNVSYGLELTFSSPLFDWFRTNTSFTYFKNEFEGLGISNSDYSWLAKMNNNFMLSKDFNFQINLNYNAPTIMGQSKMKEQFATDFAMKKDFLDGQLSLTFRVSDVFNTRKWESETIGQNFVTSSYRKMESRVAYLGISYRLSPNNNNRERERRPRDEEGMDEF